MAEVYFEDLNSENNSDISLHIEIACEGEYLVTVYSSL